jgi:hypothetical protein
MLPRKKLIQCFTCKNNIACWGLTDDIELGRSEKEFYPDHKKFLNSIDQMREQYGSLHIGEYFGMISSLFMRTLREDGDVSRRDVYSLICVLAAMCNTSNEDWTCPDEEDNFRYEAREI